MSAHTFPDRWPRAMKRSTAAAYCDMTPAAFEKEILSGRLPAGFTVGGREHWCRKALDAALDRLAGHSNDDVPDYRRRYHERHG